MTPRIVVCDDSAPLREMLADDLQALVGDEASVVAQPITWLRANLEVLEERMRSVRLGDPLDTAATPCDLDAVDVLILDFDLFDPSAEEFLETGSDLAYLVRWLSECPIVVVLNEEKVAGFDLRLPDRLDSFADLDVPIDLVVNARLWGANPVAGSFAPWRWSNLLDAARRRRRQIDWLLQEGRLDGSPFETLGIPFDPPLSAELLDQIGDQAFTWRQIVADSPLGLRPRDVEHLGSLADEQIARIAAARVSKFIEHLLIAGQEVLVDGPHLVARHPVSTLADPARWQESTTWDSETDPALFGLERAEVYEARRLRHSMWASRPVWHWPGLVNCQDLPEVVDPWSTPLRALVFAEDTSRFIPSDDAQMFRCTLPTPFVKRHVEKVDGKRYYPERYLVDY